MFDISTIVGEFQTALMANPYFQAIPPQLQVMIVAVLPILELRVAIPYGLFIGLPWYSAFFWALLGNMLPNFFILWALPIFGDWLRAKIPMFDRFLNNLQEKHHAGFQKWGLLFVAFFIGVPIPGSGSWTGSVIAYIFELGYWKSILAVALGVLMAGLIILGVTMGGLQVIHSFFWGGAV